MRRKLYIRSHLVMIQWRSCSHGSIDTLQYFFLKGFFRFLPSTFLLALFADIEHLRASSEGSSHQNWNNFQLKLMQLRGAFSLNTIYRSIRRQFIFKYEEVTQKSKVSKVPFTYILFWLPFNTYSRLSYLIDSSACPESSFPEYLKLNLHKVGAYSFRSSIAPVLSIPKESGTFQHSSATTFNKLPVAIKNITEYNTFSRSVKRHLLCKEF